MARCAFLVAAMMLGGAAHAQSLEGLIKGVHPAYNKGSGALDDHFHVVTSDIARDASGNHWVALLISARKDGRYSPTDLEVEIIRAPPRQTGTLLLRRSANVAGTRPDVDDSTRLTATWRPIKIAAKETALALTVEGGSKVMGDWLREVTWYRVTTGRPILGYQEVYEGGQRCGTVDTTVDVKPLKKQTLGFYDFKLTTLTERATGLCDDGEHETSRTRESTTLQWDGTGYGTDEGGPAQFTIIQDLTASSSRPDDGAGGGPLMAADGREDTAWLEGDGAGPGIGQALTITLLGVLPVQALILTNGLATSPETFARHGRIKSALLRFDDGTTATVELRDTSAAQVIPLPQITRTRVIRLEIREVYKGTSSDDTALSEVRVELQP